MTRGVGRERKGCRVRLERDAGGGERDALDGDLETVRVGEEDRMKGIGYGRACSSSDIA